MSYGSSKVDHPISVIYEVKKVGLAKAPELNQDQPGSQLSEPGCI